MREILFRGKMMAGEGWSPEDEEWVYGDLIQNKVTADETEYLIKRNQRMIKVHPETIGQYTGLRDKEGARVFDGDIIMGKDFLGITGVYEIAWNGAISGWGCKSYDLDDSFPEELREKGFVFSGTPSAKYDVTVIGNINDNPELLHMESGKEEVEERRCCEKCNGKVIAACGQRVCEKCGDVKERRK
ncbi:YopX protein [Andreesenia angusta]|uniref:YopX protein n=1 Tax=Andreesenia angusta TaxID=39480 RepID=A0A1S1V9W7_9FIRM|nr:YopX family protein [Andreesenia angusta]OHW62927.1 YopX protein [Andreesenia angusta]